jgi:hypothetical protein
VARDWREKVRPPPCGCFASLQISLLQRRAKLFQEIKVLKEGALFFAPCLAAPELTDTSHRLIVGHRNLSRINGLAPYGSIHTACQQAEPGQA